MQTLSEIKLLVHLHLAGIHLSEQLPQVPRHLDLRLVNKTAKGEDMEIKEEAIRLET
jgi:CRISPR/Cas system-associated endonuclease Cas3-HD